MGNRCKMGDKNPYGVDNQQWLSFFQGNLKITPKGGRMENEINIKPAKNRWKRACIAVSIVSGLALLSCVTLLIINNIRYTQNYDIFNKEISTRKQQLEKCKTSASIQCSADVASEQNQNADRYLIVKEWGVKFKVEAFSELSYSITENRLDFKGELRSIPSWELDGGFSFDSAKDDIRYIIRQPQNNDPLKKCKESCPIIVASINDYNLYLGHSQNNSYNSFEEENYAGVAIYLLDLMISNAEAI